MRIVQRIAILGVIVCTSTLLQAQPQPGFTEAWRSVWDSFNDRYSYFGHKGVDWDQVWTDHQNDFQDVGDPIAFSNRLNDILQVLHDWHVAVLPDNSPGIGYRGVVEFNFDPAGLVSTRYTGGVAYQNFKDAGAILHAWIDSSIAHIIVATLGPKFTDNLSESDIDELFATYRNADGLIIDLRANSGGNEVHARWFANRLVREPFTYGYIRSRVHGSDHDAFTPFSSKMVSPSEGVHYDGPVAGLIGQGAVSSAEWFALMLASIPNARLIGDRTRGASGNPVVLRVPDLPVAYSLSTWIAYDANKEPFEDRGIWPDIPIPPNESFDSDHDYVIERAIDWIRVGDRDLYGVPFSWIDNHGLDITETSDADQDGALDRHEFLAGTDPTNPDSSLRITGIRQQNNQRILRWMSAPEKIYRVLVYSGVVGNAGFESVTDSIPSEGEFTETALPNDNGLQTFYRVELLPN